MSETFKGETSEPKQDQVGEDEASNKCDLQRQTSTKSALQLLAEVDEETIENLERLSTR